MNAREQYAERHKESVRRFSLPLNEQIEYLINDLAVDNSKNYDPEGVHGRLDDMNRMFVTIVENSLIDDMRILQSLAKKVNIVNGLDWELWYA